MVASVSFRHVPNILLVLPCFLAQYVLSRIFPASPLELSTFQRALVPLLGK